MASVTASHDVTHAGAAPAIPRAGIAPRAVFVGTEQGAFAPFNGMSVGAFVHGGCHLPGFRCH